MRVILRLQESSWPAIATTEQRTIRKRLHAGETCGQPRETVVVGSYFEIMLSPMPWQSDHMPL